MDELSLIKYNAAIELLEKIKLLVDKTDSIQVTRLIQVFTEKVDTYKKTVPDIVRPTKTEISRIKEGWKKTIKVKYLTPILNELRKSLGEEPYPDNFDKSTLNKSELDKYYSDWEKYYAKENVVNDIYEKIKDESYEIFENTKIPSDLIDKRILLSRTVQKPNESKQDRILINDINKKVLKIFEEKNKQFIDDKLLGIYKTKLSV